MYQKFRTSFALLSLIVLSACGSDSPTPGPSDATVLEGSWKIGCMTGMTETMTFTGSGLTWTVEVFGDAACTTPMWVQEGAYTFSLGAAVTAPADSNVFDKTYLSYRLRFTSAAAVASAISANQCGFSDWQLNVSKDVTGTNCDSKTAGEVSYDVYHVSGSQLRLGDRSGVKDATTAEKRPDTLETKVYTKQ